MSIVMWKVLETKVASDEEDVLYRRLEARLERVARESAVPIGAHWESPPQDKRVDQSETMLGAPLAAAPAMTLLAPPPDAGIELVAEEHEPARDTVDEPVVAVEERQTPPALESERPGFQARPAGPERELGPRVARATARPRTAAGPAPLRAVAVRPVEERLCPTARRAAIKTTPNS